MRQTVLSALVLLALMLTATAPQAQSGRNRRGQASTGAKATGQPATDSDDPVLFTDGVDTTSRQASYSGTVLAAAQPDAPVYTVAYDSSDDVRGGSWPGRSPGGRGGIIIGIPWPGGGGGRGGGPGGGGGSRVADISAAI